MEKAEKEERPRSSLYALEPLVRRMPEVAVPKRRVSFREKFMWTGIALLVFFIMTQVPLYGPAAREPFEDVNGNGIYDEGIDTFTDLNGNGVWNAGVQEFFGQLRYVLASHAGSLMELGIGPIVTAGIIMQLLVGSKIIGLDLTNSDDRALFTGVQKFGALIMGLFEGAMLVLAGHYGFGIGLGTPAGLFILLQLTLGVVIVIYLDELVSKYGFGSGISLFILGGVAMTVIWQALNPATGVIPNFAGAMLGGESFGDAFFRPGLPNMMGLFATILIFFIVVYVENMRIEIPLAYGKFGGIRGRYPLKFLYTSVIPVILAMVVFANLRIVGAVLHAPWIAYYTSAPAGISGVAADPIHAVVYIALLVLLSMGFSWLWVNMTGMGPRDIAQQLDRSGMLIPGFRRDTRVMEWVLSRYIMTVALLGGASVGLLSAGADALGALGSGTGILLAVSIMYSLYQEIAKERVAEMFPAVRRFLGE
ncbi:MAG: preprotein translocase subunit SecY [Hadesarchaea archaeon]|nr:preprotein translocase subunit SecY [Hadesarchaea archaeon]